MKLAHVIVGLCLAGGLLPARADVASVCAAAAPDAAAWPPAADAHGLAPSIACPPTAGAPTVPAHEAAELRLYDTPRAARAAMDADTDAAPPAARTLADPRAARPLNAAQRRVLALAPRVLAVARAYDIDPLLLHAIAHVESRHHADARSAAGAVGVLQVMPGTARRFGVGDPLVALADPAVNLEVGAAYLKTLQARFGNDLPLVLAAYNAGEGAVERHGRSVPPYAETRDYVRRVLAEYRLLRAALARVAAAADVPAGRDGTPANVPAVEVR
ncbi:MAG: lytic transglycosylase domain-containing protein [Burkholderiaceae bacterium]